MSDFVKRTRNSDRMSWPEGVRMRLERVGADEELELGASHFFGFPDVPRGFDFPCTDDECDLAFVAQLRLRDVPARTRTAAHLPADGLLLFFADVDYCLGDADADPPPTALQPRDRVRVVLVPADQLAPGTLLRGTIVDADGNPCCLPAHRVVFVERHNGGSNDEDEDEGAEAGAEEKHQLFGEPEDMPYEDYDADAAGFRLLLQVDSCEGPDFCAMFGDEGLYTFIIDPAALARGDFSGVRGWLASS